MRGSFDPCQRSLLDAIRPRAPCHRDRGRGSGERHADARRRVQPERRLPDGAVGRTANLLPRCHGTGPSPSSAGCAPISGSAMSLAKVMPRAWCDRPEHCDLYRLSSERACACALRQRAWTPLAPKCCAKRAAATRSCKAAAMMLGRNRMTARVVVPKEVSSS